jgi:uncharacterized phage-associated protein
MVLQKLLYYAQGFHLALQGEPLFGEEIEAWEHVPVIPSIYESYKRYRKRAIDRHDLGAADIGERLAPETREILDVVQAVYGQIPAWRLSKLAHLEPPWSKTRRRTVIQHGLPRDFFSSLVNSGMTGDSISSEPVWPTNTLRHQRRKEIMRLAPNREKLRRILDRVPSPDPWTNDEED